MLLLHIVFVVIYSDDRVKLKPKSSMQVNLFISSAALITNSTIFSKILPNIIMVLFVD